MNSRTAERIHHLNHQRKGDTKLAPNALNHKMASYPKSLILSIWIQKIAVSISLDHQLQIYLHKLFKKPNNLFNLEVEHSNWEFHLRELIRASLHLDSPITNHYNTIDLSSMLDSQLD